MKKTNTTDWMEKTWRWFGPKDPISLEEIAKTQAEGIISSLHHLENGQVWTPDEIGPWKAQIESAGLRLSGVESVPVHEDIKTRSGKYQLWIENYKQSLRNLGDAGVTMVCYNFMPVLDWTRTDLEYVLGDKEVLLYDPVHVAAFDIHILGRKGAKGDYHPQIAKQATTYFDGLNNHAKKKLEKTIIMGLPGAEEGYTTDQFSQALKRYDGISPDELRSNLAYFLGQVVPVAQEAGIRMAIHPDDPPRPLFGLPRVVSTEADWSYIVKAYDSVCNGFTLCTGSLGVRADNDLVGMVHRYGDRINYAHLRNVVRFNQLDGCEGFYESGDHLEGDVPMAEVVRALLHAQQEHSHRIPMRPDHGAKVGSDFKRETNPGYSYEGRKAGMNALIDLLKR